MLHVLPGAASTETSVDAPVPSAAAATAAADEGSSRCPVLAALARPPTAPTAWWQRPLQIFTPTWFQRTAVGSNPVVHVPAAVSLPDQYYVADADLAKQLLQDEAGAHPKITMDDKLVDFVGECQQLGKLDQLLWLVVCPITPAHAPRVPWL
jgi:hypothetical protein